MDDEGKLLLIRGRRKKVTMAAGGVVFLVLGALIAPADDRSKPTNTVPDEPVAPLLEVERSDPMTGFQPWLEAGSRAMQRTVSVSIAREAPTPRSRQDLHAPTAATTDVPGVLVRPGRILTHGELFAEAAFRSELAVVTPDGRYAARVDRCDPESGLMLLAADGLDGREPAPLGPAPSGEGTPAIAASLLGGRPVLLPVLMTGLQQGMFRLGLSVPPAGTAAFDRDGKLIGLAGASGSGWAAESALSRLDGLRAPVPLSLGLTVQPITDDLRPLIEPPGVLVATADATAAGVRAGDVVVRVGNTDVATVADYDRALAGISADASVTLTLRRGRETVEQAVQPHPACVTSQVADPPAAAATASTIFEAAALQAAGLPGAAALLDVDGRDPAKWRARRREAALVRAQVAGQPPAFYVVRP